MLDSSKKNQRSKNNKIIDISEPKNKNNNSKKQNKRIIVSKRTKNKQKGNYILENTIGEGAFAKVKLGKHIITGEKVAIKILPKQNISSNSNENSSNNINKIQKEINILRRLHHKNIIQLYEIIETKNNLYIVMEYCEGKELFDYIVKRKHLTEREACRYFQQIINGVEYLHLCNITHRDLKPENILLDNKKRIRISDFGLSGIVPEYDSLLSTPCGTPLYAPPEMLRGEKYNGVYSDIWSCGIILYTMLVGDLPYADSKEKIIYQNIMTHNYYYPDTISDDAVDLIEHMLKINPKERYGFKEIKAHPWFNLVTPKLRPGVINNVHKIPVDEKILDKIEKMGYDRNLCKKSVLENNYDSLMAIYLLTLKQSIKEGKESISDLFSDEYLKYINDYKNWIDTSKINNPLYNEYNILNNPLNDISDENININLGIDNTDTFTDSDNYLNTLDNIENDNLNINNISNEEKNDYLNILKRKSEDISSNINNESFNVRGSLNKRLTLKNSIIKEMKDISEVNNMNNNKSFESDNISSTILMEEEKPLKIETELTLDNTNKSHKNILKKEKEKENQIKKNKALVSLKTELDKIKINPKNNNKKINLDEIIQKRIMIKQNTQKTTPSKVYPNQIKMKDDKRSSIISNNDDKLDNISNRNIEDSKTNNKINETKITIRDKISNSNIVNKNNNICQSNNNKLEDNEYLDKMFNDNLMDLMANSNLILTPSGRYNDYNSESKTLFSKDENVNISINSGNNNLNISKKLSNNIKNLNLNLNNISKISNLNVSKKNTYISKTRRNSKSPINVRNVKKNKKDNIILLTEPIDIKEKNKLKKEIEDDLIKFDNDLKLIDDMSKTKFIKFESSQNVNINEDLGIFNIQIFSDKLIRNTIFKNYLLRNNKKSKHEVGDKFYILEKYKNAIGQIEKLKNKIFMDKLSNFNFYTFDKYLQDDDDKIISSHLLKNKKLASFIKKAKESIFSNVGAINRRSYSKNNTYIFSNEILNHNNINLKMRSKTPKCQLNNIIMNQTHNAFHSNKYKRYNALYKTKKISYLTKKAKKNKLNTILFKNFSPDDIYRANIHKYSHSIEVSNSSRSKYSKRDSSINSIKNKSLRKRLLFKNNLYLTDNNFKNKNNSIKKYNSYYVNNFQLDYNNSNSSIDSIIIEENNDTNNSKKKLNLKTIILNDTSITPSQKRHNVLNLKIENKEKKKKATYYNNIINTINIQNNSDKKMTKFAHNDNSIDDKKIRNKTIDKITSKRVGLSMTPDNKKSNKYKKRIINNNNTNLKLDSNNKTKGNFNKKYNMEKRETVSDIRNNLRLKDKSKEKEKEKIKPKCEVKELKENYPIDIRSIFILSFDEVKIKIKKYLKKVKCSFIENENNARILRNGININLTFYSIKDFDVNNIYICFKSKGENQKNFEFIQDLLYYLHKN